MIKIIKKITKRPTLVLFLIIFIGLVAGVIIRAVNPSLPGYELAIVQKGELVQEVNVTGRVKPAESVQLSFEKSGLVSWVNTSVGEQVFKGQILIQLSSADLAAQLTQAKATVKAELAKLDELLKGTRPEEVQIQEVKVANAKEDLMNKLQDGYTKGDDAIRNKTDQFISNPRSNPQLVFSTDQQIENEIELNRLLIEEILSSWEVSFGNLTENNINEYLEKANKNLNKIQSFLNTAALALSTLTPSSGLTQTTIDSYKSNVSTARTNINIALTNITSANSTLIYEENQLIFKQAGATAGELLIQEARIEEAEANVQNIQAQISKAIIFSPINGVVTGQEAKVGEIVAANTPVVSVISASKMEIEAFIPEVDVAKLSVGDEARVILDAYSNDIIFKASVVSINPAETIIEGVSTYKTILQFNEKDERVRSGMTADIDIITEVVPEALIIPQRAVITKDAKKIVRVFENGEVVEKEIQTGIRSVEGQIEILEGLEEGETIIVFIK